MFLSISTRIAAGKPPRAIWRAATLLGLYRIWASPVSAFMQNGGAFDRFRREPKPARAPRASFATGSLSRSMLQRNPIRAAAKQLSLSALVARNETHVGHPKSQAF